MTTVTVTVSVDPLDVFDVLAWREGWDGHVMQPLNDRLLALYDNANDEDRLTLWHLMPASLQWAVHEAEHRGDAHLRTVMRQGGVKVPTRDETGWNPGIPPVHTNTHACCAECSNTATSNWYRDNPRDEGVARD